MGWSKGKCHSPQAREKIRQAQLGHPVSLATRERLRQANLRPETRENIAQAQRGKKVSAQTREKLRQAALRPGVQEKKRQAMLGHRHTPETRAKIRKAALGRKHSLVTREKCRQARLRQTFPKKMTAIERILYVEFKKRRLHFEMYKVMFDRFQPDFVFETARLIVQADGDYWHRLPNNIRCDRDFAKAASADGWSVWRFGEQEIRMHGAACGQAVARFIRSR